MSINIVDEELEKSLRLSAALLVTALRKTAHPTNLDHWEGVSTGEHGDWDLNVTTDDQHYRVHAYVVKDGKTETSLGLLIHVERIEQWKPAAGSRFVYLECECLPLEYDGSLTVGYELGRRYFTAVRDDGFGFSYRSCDLLLTGLKSPNGNDIEHYMSSVWASRWFKLVDKTASTDT